MKVLAVLFILLIPTICHAHQVVTFDEFDSIWKATKNNGEKATVLGQYTTSEDYNDTERKRRKDK